MGSLMRLGVSAGPNRPDAFQLMLKAGPILHGAKARGNLTAQTHGALWQ